MTDGVTLNLNEASALLQSKQSNTYFVAVVVSDGADVGTYSGLVPTRLSSRCGKEVAGSLKWGMFERHFFSVAYPHRRSGGEANEKV